MVSALVRAGKGRGAALLRSYLHTAYELAIASTTDAPDSFWKAVEIEEERSGARGNDSHLGA
jgi:hypothetical protein